MIKIKLVLLYRLLLWMSHKQTLSEICHLVNTYLVFEPHRRRPCGSEVDHLRVILYLFFLVSSSAEMHSRFDQRHLVSYSVQRLLIHILQFQEQHWPRNQYEMLRWFFFLLSLPIVAWREHLFISCHQGNSIFFYN